MKAEDTILSKNEQFKLSPEGAREDLCMRQANISFKAGIEEVINFIDSVNMIESYYCKTWQDQKKKWGIL